MFIEDMEDLWRLLLLDKSIYAALLSSGIDDIRFNYGDEGYLELVKVTRGADRTPIIVVFTNQDEGGLATVEVELFMSAAFAHSFWLGKENPTRALLQGKIKAKGPVEKVLKLLPVIKPAFEIYKNMKGVA